MYQKNKRKTDPDTRSAEEKARDHAAALYWRERLREAKSNCGSASPESHAKTETDFAKAITRAELGRHYWTPGQDAELARAMSKRR